MCVSVPYIGVVVFGCQSVKISTNLIDADFYDLPEDLELAVVFFTSSILMIIWEKRRKKT